MEPRLLGFAGILMLSSCWQYLEPGMYRQAEGGFVPEDFLLYNQSRIELLEHQGTYFRVAVLHSREDELGLAFLVSSVDYYSLHAFYDYTRLGDEGDVPNFVLCDRAVDRFTCKSDKGGRLIMGSVNSLNGFTLFGSGSESQEGTVMNGKVISFTYEFQTDPDLSGGKDPWTGEDIFTQADWERLQSDFDEWMAR